MNRRAFLQLLAGTAGATAAGVAALPVAAKAPEPEPDLALGIGSPAWEMQSIPEHREPLPLRNLPSYVVQTQDQYTLHVGGERFDFDVRGGESAMDVETRISAQLATARSDVWVKVHDYAGTRIIHVGHRRGAAGVLYLATGDDVRRAYGSDFEGIAQLADHNRAQPIKMYRVGEG